MISMASILSMKSNRIVASSTSDIAALTTRVGNVESKIGAGITTSVTVMINSTPTYKTLNFTNGILTSVV